MENKYINKEWTDHRNGYRYYVDYLGDKVKVRIATYPDRETIFKTEVDRLDFENFINYIQDNEN